MSSKRSSRSTAALRSKRLRTGNGLNGAEPKAQRLNGGAKPRLNGAQRLNVRAAYEAASAGRRLRLWQPGMVGPNTAVLRDLTQLRDRSRDLVRNNPWISRG